MAPPEPRLTTLGSISRTRYALVMGVTSLVAVACSVLTAIFLGAPSDTAIFVAGAIAVCAAASIAPLLSPTLVSDNLWGLAVLASSAGRTILALGAMLILIQLLKLPDRPVAIGVLVGVCILMIVEAIGAVSLLAKRDRELAALRTSSPGSVSGAGSNR